MFSSTLFEMDEDTVLCAMEWINLLESIPAFDTVFPPKKQSHYFIILADCVVMFRADDWDEILADWVEDSR